ncbi:MBL fold metallo-hydrolase [Candidatus Woesearchaeota archaeon]|nr:MBL fold metallo-hydrolase [Candidatus Woesearchaeota archaeon]
MEIVAVGGYGESGKNMTAVRVGNDVVILDMGLHMPNYIQYTEEEVGEGQKLSESELKRVKAIPDDTVIKDWWKDVKAIVVTHAHLDHIGATPYLEHNYKCPIIVTPFSAAVLKTIIRDDRLQFRNEIVPLQPNSTYKVNEKLKIEFIHATHSTPQTIIAAIHTSEGVIVYGNDFKLDNHPTLGKRPNIERLQKLGESGKVTALILDCLYSRDHRKMPSELIAKEMLRDVLLGVDSRGKAVIVSTFSSHIARLKSIAEFGSQMRRKVIFLGRSIAKYTEAAEEARIADFSDVEIVKYGSKVKRRLKDLAQKRDKYLFVMTGHQGEPKALLSRVARRALPFYCKPGDHVVFSCKTIPAEVNQKNRELLEELLKEQGVRIFTDIHVSGHCAREDLRDVITMLKPAHIFPTHGEKPMTDAFLALAAEAGYQPGHTVHVLQTGQRKRIAHHGHV